MTATRRFGGSEIGMERCVLRVFAVVIFTADATFAVDVIVAAVIVAEAYAEAAPRRPKDVVVVVVVAKDDERLHALLQHRHKQIVLKALVARVRRRFVLCFFLEFSSGLRQRHGRQQTTSRRHNWFSTIKTFFGFHTAANAA